MREADIFIYLPIFNVIFVVFQVNGFEVNRSRIGSQRKPIKKTKESNFNRRHKEIIKLNYSSKKLNAKRNLILRHFDLYTLRKVFNKSFVLDKACREIEDEIFFDQYLSEDSGELIIENDKDFKMIARLKSQKFKAGFKVDEKFKVVKQSDNDSSTEINLDSNDQMNVITLVLSTIWIWKIY